MNYTEIMVRYGELSTKGKNKRTFINRLSQNVRRALHDFPEIKILGERDHMYLELNGADSHIVMKRLEPIFGIQNYSPVVRLPRDMDVVKKVAVEMVQSVFKEGQTFKITTKRADHLFELDTNDINQLLGAEVLRNVEGIKVQVKKPDIEVKVEVRLEGIFLSCQRIAGAGGLPVGSGGRAMLMLSGGIDSPVAGYLAMKRGVEVQAVHFHSPPYTSPRALQKAKDLTVKLTAYVGSIQFIEVPFTEIQEEIKRVVPEGYLMTVTRRMMMRLTDKIREQQSGLAIVNGESLGQVASQTLQSMVSINEVTNTPIIRPVVSMDKNEIIEIAQKIDTLELSIQPFEDCCTIFAPPAPKTKPKLEKAQKFEARLDVDGLIERAMAGLVISEIKTGDSLEEQQEEAFSEFL
ncbi:tRNA uracil 4-sulfurtransferase ThiI [Carnobacterium maltaromaticum]|jgi:thiamine biosynthesis protein ThiI|uniref:Probable tRNA sulfurtransferase n=1 Tax=Carnobacterium maltaromaticum LMA28 TaxID=1234679 RepID=K8EFW2_CARML|nr:tRNA uracil 4-sulfurtransferase ThiI [Carnobacterium maltaromaticum]AOA01691.1 tRNA 4-thiouridine(8) synthase ThiI [Carnobacterium maltaromaticum]KRN64877.1 tRNA sulfurtransferase [Carnobacterium maltaromaticum DSM 20342]MCI1817877.1 tRNA 4-thiouridine(8) synthase ThiI [Carnobacterium maltaromaticum]CCO10723.2 thiamine biosynthesis/tRNA modification protein ThiI [Carnobacterium maltaromaticum LMA28]